MHVNTAKDFETAIALGADGAAHLPPVYVQADESDDMFIISEETADAAAKAGFITTPTSALVYTAAQGEISDDTAALYERAKKLQTLNLERLRAAGAPIAIGSDLFSGDAVDELLAIKELGVYPDKELLQIAVETPSNSIFPGRAIGTLAPGWEASFLALACDPAETIECIKDVTRLTKQGVDIPLSD